MALADEGGIESLSMRKLAGKLGYEVMSLYNHVANKDEILDALVDAVAAEIETGQPGGEWKASMRKRIVSAHDALHRHPWATALWSSQRTGPARLAFNESLLRGLRDGGFSAELSYHGYHAFVIHILGYTRQELNLPFTTEELPQRAAEFLRTFPVDRYPHLAEHMMQHIEPTHPDDDFVFILDLLLDGLERMRDEASGRSL